MPNYKTHLFGGLATFLITICIIKSININLSSNLVYACLVASLIGALFPDIDTKSKIQRLLYLSLLILMLYLIIKQSFLLFTTLAIMSVIPLIVNHRTVFHHPWFLIGLNIILYFGAIHIFPKHNFSIFLISIFFTLGCLSHIVLDVGIKKTTKKIFGI